MILFYTKNISFYVYKINKLFGTVSLSFYIYKCLANGLGNVQIKNQHLCDCIYHIFSSLFTVLHQSNEAAASIKIPPNA